MPDLCEEVVRLRLVRDAAREFVEAFGQPDTQAAAKLVALRKAIRASEKEEGQNHD